MELQIQMAQDVATKGYADGSTVIGLQLDITGLGANAGNNDVRGVLLRKTIPQAVIHWQQDPIRKWKSQTV